MGQKGRGNSESKAEIKRRKIQEQQQAAAKVREIISDTTPKLVPAPGPMTIAVAGPGRATEVPPFKNPNVWIVLLTFVLAGTAISQCTITSGQLKEMVRSTGQTERALLLSEENLKMAEDTARKQLRAYVGFEKVQMEPPVPERPSEKNGRIGLLVKNFGQTPAYNVKATLSWYHEPIQLPDTIGRLPADFSYPIPARRKFSSVQTYASKADLDPSQTNVNYVILDDSALVFDADFNRTYTTYFYGEIDYTDGYGVRRVRDYCYLYVPGNAPDYRLVVTDAHNGERKIEE